MFNRGDTRTTSLKGSLAKEARFAGKRDSGTPFVGPGSYNAEKAYKLLNDNRSSSVFSRGPANSNVFENSNEYIMIGSSVKHAVNLKNTAG